MFVRLQKNLHTGFQRCEISFFSMHIVICNHRITMKGVLMCVALFCRISHWIQSICYIHGNGQCELSSLYPFLCVRYQKGNIIFGAVKIYCINLMVSCGTRYGSDPAINCRLTVMLARHVNCHAKQSALEGPDWFTRPWKTGNVE
jgi:hypothetical protein